MDSPKVFIRFDDVDSRSKELEKLVELFVGFKIPINLGVVPARVTRDLVLYLKKLKKNYPNFIEIDQHGVEHKRHNKGEFDVEDNILLTKLSQGNLDMKKLFGGEFSNIITVPWHAHSNSFPRIAQAIGFKAISINHRTDRFASIFYLTGKLSGRNSIFGYHVSRNFELSQNRILEISPSIDWARSYKDKGTLKSLQDVTREFKHLIKKQEYIGVLIHPQHFYNKSKINLLKQFIQEIKRTPGGIEFLSISQLVDLIDKQVTQSQQEEYYNQNEFYFKHLKKKHNLVYFNQVLRMFRKIPKYDKDLSLIEIGSGSGNFLEILVKNDYISDNQLYAVDISSIGLKMHKFGVKIRANAKKLPFEDNSFDISVTIDTLEHILKYEEALNEMYRITKPGGYIILRTQNYDCPLLQFEGHDLKIYSKIVADRDAVSKTSATQIAKTFKSLDGKIISSETWASFNWKIPLLRIFNKIPILKYRGATCALIFQKSANTAKKSKGDKKINFRCPNCFGEISQKTIDFKCLSCQRFYSVYDNINDFYIEK